jgi:hypothetical protein
VSALDELAAVTAEGVTAVSAIDELAAAALGRALGVFQVRIGRLGLGLGLEPDGSGHVYVFHRATGRRLDEMADDAELAALFEGDAP